MALKIRLRQQGRNNLASFRLVVTDVRAPRGGKYVEALGWYNPAESNEERQLSIKPDRIQHWLNIGAQLTEEARSLVARAAPDVMREYSAKQLAHREKVRLKRRARAAAKKG